MAASKQTNLHMHFRYAVPLVWGSLRLAPIKVCACIYTYLFSSLCRWILYNKLCILSIANYDRVW